MRNATAADGRDEAPPSGRDAAPARWHGFDGLRAVIVVLGVGLHAAVPFLDLPVAGLPWAVRAGEPSALLTHFFWWFHAVQIPLFFLLAGFFAAHTVGRDGPATFLRHRLRRLLLPLLAAAAVLLPITFYVYAAGWWLAGDCTWNEIRRVKFAPPLQAELFGPAHLWFLEYLVLYCLLYWSYRAWRPQPRPARGALWLPLATAAIIAVDPGVYTAHHNRFVPIASVFLHQGVFFAAGAWLHAQRHRLRGDARIAAAAAIVALPLFAVVEALTRRQLATPLGLAGRILFALALALLIWTTIAGAIAAALRWGDRPSPRLRYVAAASYWIYLLHLPLLVALQLALVRLPLPPLVGWSVAVALTTAVCLWTYGRWVRGTALGVWLDGDRRAPAPAAMPAAWPAGAADAPG